MGKRIHGLVGERNRLDRLVDSVARSFAFACRKLNPGIIGAAFRLGECARCTSPSRSHRRLRVTVCAKRARTAGCPQRFARCVAIWCDAQRRVVERCDAPRRFALPTVMSISPTRLID
jgi:hypothetical protein